MVVARNRVLVPAALLLLVAAVYLALELNRSSRHEVLTQFATLQSLLARQAAHEVLSYLQKCAVDSEALAQLPPVAAGDAAGIRAAIAAYYESGAHYQPQLILLLTPEGRPVFSTGRLGTQEEYQDADFIAWARQPEMPGRVFISTSGPLIRVGRGASASGHFLLATRVTGSKDSGRGWSRLLVMAFDIEPTLAEHLALLTPETDAHRVWIMDADGTILLQSEHPEMAWQNIHQTQPQCAECHQSFDYARTMLVERLGTTQYQLNGQSKKLAAFAPVDFANASWIVVVNAPYAEVTAFVQRGFLKMSGLLAVLLAACGLAGMAVHQSNVSKVRAQSEARQWQEKHELSAAQAAMAEKNARLNDELRRRNAELQTAMDNIKTLNGLLPICAYCKKIRNDEGYWLRVETYIQQHAPVTFSHGICPECCRQYHPDIFPDAQNE